MIENNRESLNIYKNNYTLIYLNCSFYFNLFFDLIQRWKVINLKKIIKVIVTLCAYALYFFYWILFNDESLNRWISKFYANIVF